MTVALVGCADDPNNKDLSSTEEGSSTETMMPAPETSETESESEAESESESTDGPIPDMADMSCTREDYRLNDVTGIINTDDSVTDSVLNLWGFDETDTYTLP